MEVYVFREEMRCWQTGASVHYEMLSLQKRQTNLLLLVTDPISHNRSWNGRKEKLWLWARHRFQDVLSPWTNQICSYSKKWNK